MRKRSPTSALCHRAWTPSASAKYARPGVRTLMLGPMGHFRRMAFARQVRMRSGKDGVIYLQHPRQYHAPARNLVDLLAQAIHRHGSRPFMHERSGAGWFGLTYAGSARVALYASALRRQGVRAGDIVAFWR